ncbi:hypothetical protein H5410_015638, partial [Solanum commersonii]
SVFFPGKQSPFARAPSENCAVVTDRNKLCHCHRRKKLQHGDTTKGNGRVIERLTLIGNAALDLAISSYFFVTYPDVDCGKISGLSTADASTEKLVRVAVQHGLYKCLSRNLAILDEKEFVKTVQQEEEIEFYGGTIKEPEVLADIVESIMGAVYLDCGFDVNDVWVVSFFFTI